MLFAFLIAAIMAGTALWVAYAKRPGGATGVAAIGIAFIVGRELDASFDWYPNWGTVATTTVVIVLFVVGMSVDKERNGRWFKWALIFSAAGCIPVSIIGMVLPDLNLTALGHWTEDRINEVPPWVVTFAMGGAVVGLLIKWREIRDLIKSGLSRLKSMKSAPSSPAGDTPPAA